MAQGVHGEAGAVEARRLASPHLLDEREPPGIDVRAAEDAELAALEADQHGGVGQGRDRALHRHLGGRARVEKLLHGGQHLGEEGGASLGVLGVGAGAGLEPRREDLRHRERELFRLVVESTWTADVLETEDAGQGDPPRTPGRRAGRRCRAPRGSRRARGRGGPRRRSSISTSVAPRMASK
jgi:hypothetical protein